MSSATDKMIAQFSNLEDLSAFAKAQQKTLLELTKKNKVLEDETKHLKKLLEGTVPVINPNPKTSFSTNDEESIAREQLFLLKQKSTNEELTYEETKKVEIYSKILNTLKTNHKTIDANSKDISTTDVLKLLKESNDDSSS